MAEIKLDESENKFIYVFNNVLDFNKKSVKFLTLVLIENVIIYIFILD